MGHTLRARVARSHTGMRESLRSPFGYAKESPPSEWVARRRRNIVVWSAAEAFRRADIITPGGINDE
jgi:hypothetical protein